MSILIMADLNAVVQIIVSEPGAVAYQKMCAGSGWFPSTEHEVPVGTILTNAHVVDNAQRVFIRLPAQHTLDIPAYVHAVSTDLDLAILRLSDDNLKKVKGILKKKYGVDEIPTLQMGDSDTVHPTTFSSMTAPRVIARGYPLGTEYQQFTDGRVSGLKHINEQEYIVTTATINPGNSGGPLVTEDNKAIGINSMKMTNADGINMSIPSNRIKAVLKTMMDNSSNQHRVEEMVQLATMFGNVTLNEKQQIESMFSSIPGVSPVQVMSYWNKHNVGGHKRTGQLITPVKMKDWYNKHVKDKPGGHGLFEKVIKHLHNEELDELVKMKKTGFQHYLCEKCADGNECSPVPPQYVPPNSMHMPILGYVASNSSGQATLDYYGNPLGVKSGIIISGVHAGDAFHRAGVCKGDFLYEMVVEGKRYKLDDYGEAWMDRLSVSLPVNDILHRSKLGSTIELKVVNSDGEKRTRVMNYDFLHEKHKPHIRMLDSMADQELAKQIVEFQGIVMKPLRLNDVMQYRMEEYAKLENRHKFKVMVADIDVDSDAFHARNLRPGDIITHVNSEKVADNWSQFMSTLQDIQEDEVTLFETESGRMLIV